MEADRIYRALADGVRRQTLRELPEGETVPISTLAEAIAAGGFSTGDGPTHETVQLSLYHTHLPLLCDAGLVEFDEDQKVVTMTTLGKTVHAEILQPSQELLENDDFEPVR
ncbi:helix-turn-helix domain-containing protein [Haloarcula nitratireducens]|uniref:Helix-turn-helix domain-containing protein n=1 Tax=Haloarcula nitratireducens TaxID=2487749 RepID=A0AAW4PH55_9EURY|nr:helix-turn-helix domain-containing protein [Halomicroarcula nitratireducens]MBX0296770.1 helix-turn-helix domain-containing protein [Halomicroarcula nitratireducens]